MDKLTIINNIIQASKKYNLPYRVVLAQAILESGFFKKAPYFNFFGIKAKKNEPYFESQTFEYRNGQKTRIIARFRKYSSIDEAIKEYNNLIKRTYPIADKNRHNDILFLKGLFEGKYKYATDPNYIEKIKRIIKKLDTEILKKKLSSPSVYLTLLAIALGIYLIKK